MARIFWICPNRERRLPLTLSRRSPLQGRHRLDRIGRRATHPSGDRLVIEALHVLQGEFASRNVSTYLLDDTVVFDQGLGYPAIQRRFRQIAQPDFPSTPLAAGIVQGTMKFGCEIRFRFFGHCDRLHDLQCSVTVAARCTWNTLGASRLPLVLAFRDRAASGNHPTPMVLSQGRSTDPCPFQTAFR